MSGSNDPLSAGLRTLSGVLKEKITGLSVIYFPLQPPFQEVLPCTENGPLPNFSTDSHFLRPPLGNPVDAVLDGPRRRVFAEGPPASFFRASEIAACYVLYASARFFSYGVCVFLLTKPYNHDLPLTAGTGIAIVFRWRAARFLLEWYPHPFLNRPTP